MKKRLLSILLALCMVPALLPAVFAANSGSAGYSDSGSTAMTKLSKREIAQLLKDNPLTLPDNLFETVPSYTAPYSPGKVKQEALQAALNRLNALRRIAGLPSVALDSEWCNAAQYGAVLLSVSEFSHTPPRPADMDSSFYSIGYSATSTSNIYGGVSLTRAVDGFMDDSDAYNIDRLGHRRWQLNPYMSKVGFGYAAHGYYGRYVDEKVFENYSMGGGSCNYNFIAWPASGSFPSTLFNRSTAWSVTVDPSKYQTPSRSAAAVTLVRQSDGKSWTFSGSEHYTAGGSGKYFNVETSGYGISNCIIFRPDGVNQYEGVYTVTITGLRTRSGAAATLSYQVDFFDPNDSSSFDTAPAEPETPDTVFTDVPAWCADAASWAAAEGVAKGVGNHRFDPGKMCSHAEILTMLYRAQESPDAKIKSPFKVESYYQDAVDWAYGEGIINDSFVPGQYCTRADAVRYIWLARGAQPGSSGSSFPDVLPGASYAAAVSWAVGLGVTEGTNGLFNPSKNCSRGEIVTFLHRAYVPEARLK